MSDTRKSNDSLLGPVKQYPDNYDEDKSLIIDKDPIRRESTDDSLLGTPREYPDTYDENGSLIIDKEPIRRDYNENSFLDVPKESPDNYDENISLIPDKSVIRNEYMGDESLYDQAKDRIEGFFGDVVEYYDHLINAEITYWKLKALNIVNKYATKYTVEEPTMFINRLLKRNQSTEEYPKHGPSSGGYTEEQPYTGEKGNMVIPGGMSLNQNQLNVSWAKYNYGMLPILSERTDLIDKANEKYYTRSTAIDNIFKHQFKFRIMNLASNKTQNFEDFPAHITSFNESTTPSWNSMQLLNRSEDIYTYQKSDRSINLDFLLFASKQDSGDDIPENYTVYAPTGDITLNVVGKKDMWRKMNFLQSLTRPSYVDGKFDKAPFCKFWLGDIFNNVYLIVEGLTFNYDPLIWDLNDGDTKPMIVQISLVGKILHATSPSVDTEFYGRGSA